MEMVRNALTWFEIPVADFDRAKIFYETIFDYEMPEQQMGPNRMGFFLYEQQQGGIGGAIVQGEWYVPSPDGATIYLNGGNDLLHVLNRIAEAGGKVLVTKTLLSEELGYIAFFFDTEGNRLALHSMK